MCRSLRLRLSAAAADSSLLPPQVAPPLYVLTTQTLDKEVGIAALNDAVERVKASIEVRRQCAGA